MRRDKALGSGFLYAISRLGVTGARDPGTGRPGGGGGASRAAAHGGGSGRGRRAGGGDRGGEPPATEPTDKDARMVEDLRSARSEDGQAWDRARQLVCQLPMLAPDDAAAQKAVLDKVELPPGYRLVWGGEFENQRRAAC